MKKEPNPQHTLSVYFCGQEDCGPGHSFGPAMRPHYPVSYTHLDVYKRQVLISACQISLSAKTFW